MGEITYLEFETVALTAGSIEAGRLKYDDDCASCHAAGTYDETTNGASDLIGDSDKLIVYISSYAPNKKIGVANLSDQEILDLSAFLDSL
jgi:cytochrome c553